MESPLFAFDIETDTTVNGLDPGVAEIVSFAVWSPDIAEVIDGGREIERIERFFALLDEIPPGIALSWNGGCFDGAFTDDRARLAGKDSGFVLVPDPTIVSKYEFLPGHQSGYRLKLRNHRHADLAYAYQGYALENPALGRPGWSLKPVAKSLGIDMVEVDRTRIHLLSPEENAAYNLSDSYGTYRLGERLGEDLERWVDQVA